MISQDLKERYFELKGMFLESKDLLQKSDKDVIGLGISTGHSLFITHFNDFQMLLNEATKEIELSLYLNSQEVANFNILGNYNFSFDFDEINIDFEEGEECV